MNTKKLTNLTLKATKGKKTLAKATDTFSWIDGDFTHWRTGRTEKPTKAMPVEVHELITNSTFTDIFTDPEQMFLTQEQILTFVQAERQWLRTDGYGTFFLFKAGNEFFVAVVLVYSGGGLSVFVRRLSNDDVWNAECRHRIVLPQLTLTPLDSDSLTPSPSETLPEELLINGVKYKKI